MAGKRMVAGGPAGNVRCGPARSRLSVAARHGSCRRAEGARRSQRGRQSRPRPSPVRQQEDADNGQGCQGDRKGEPRRAASRYGSCSPYPAGCSSLTAVAPALYASDAWVVEPSTPTEPRRNDRRRTSLEMSSASAQCPSPRNPLGSLEQGLGASMATPQPWKGPWPAVTAAATPLGRGWTQRQGRRTLAPMLNDVPDLRRRRGHVRHSGIMPALHTDWHGHL